MYIILSCKLFSLSNLKMSFTLFGLPFIADRSLTSMLPIDDVFSLEHFQPSAFKVVCLSLIFYSYPIINTVHSFSADV